MPFGGLARQDRADELRQGQLRFAPDHEIDETMVAMQGGAHGPVTVGAAENRRSADSQLPKPSGKGEAWHILHEGCGEPDQVRRHGGYLAGGQVDEILGQRAHAHGDADIDAALAREAQKLLLAPAGIIVEDTGEDPVAHARGNSVVGDILIVPRCELSAGDVEEILRPAEVEVMLGYRDVRMRMAEYAAHDRQREGRGAERVPGHFHQMKMPRGRCQFAGGRECRGGAIGCCTSRLCPHVTPASSPGSDSSAADGSAGQPGCLSLSSPVNCRRNPQVMPIIG